jgi:dihydroorotate dehydrogenase electron transfer subunit
MVLIPARVLGTEYVAKNTYRLAVELLRTLENAEPFNFFMVWVPRVDEIPLSIAYRKNNNVDFLFKVKGEGTQRLSNLRSNDLIALKGPLGRSFAVNDSSKNILVVAGGIGIAPIPFFIFKSRYRRLDIIWGIRSVEELFDLSKLFPDISGKFNLIIATEDCSYGVCGTVLDSLRSFDLSIYDIILAVGPTAMLSKVCEYVKGTQVYVVLETMVKCGLGICGSCYIKSSTKLLCVDGPVFRCDEVKNHLRESVDS